MINRDLMTFSVPAAFCFLFVNTFGVAHPCCYDTAIQPNVGWLQMCGFSPYRDFPCTLPPLFYLGSYYAMDIGGVFWKSFVQLAAWWSVFSFAWTYALLRACGQSPGRSAFASLTFQALTSLVHCYWWHNVTLVHGIAILFLSTWALLQNPGRWLCHVSLVAAMLLVLFNKPNGWPMIPAACICLLGRHVSRHIAVFVLLAIGLSAALGIQLGSMIGAACQVAAHRGLVTSFGPPALSSRWWKLFLDADILTTLALFASILPYRLPGWRKQMLFWLTVAVIALCLLSNIESKLVSMSPLILVAVLATPDTPGHRRLLRHYWLGTLLVLGLMMGAVRERVYFGTSDFFWGPLAPQADLPPFFTGCSCDTPLVEIIAAIREVHQATRNRDTIFFGNSLEWAYPAFEVKPTRNVPVWWHQGTSYFPSDVPKIEEVFTQRRFEKLIFLRVLGEPYHFQMADTIWRAIETNYVAETAHNDRIAVYHRR